MCHQSSTVKGYNLEHYTNFLFENTLDLKPNAYNNGLRIRPENLGVDNEKVAQNSVLERIVRTSYEKMEWMFVYSC